GRPVLVLETGVGTGRVRDALGWLLGGPAGRPVRPAFVLCAGFSGALQPAWRVGDGLLASEVADLDGGLWPAARPGRPAALPRGRLLTAPRLVGTPAEKKELGKRHGAAAVDMETAAVARACAERGVPFGCVRAISDDADAALSPRLVSLLAGGRVAPW